MSDKGNETQGRWARLWDDLNSKDHNTVIDAVLAVGNLSPDEYASWDIFMTRACHEELATALARDLRVTV